MMKSSDEIVFAASPYSNSAPLVDKLSETDDRVRVINGRPADMVCDLNEGRADAALIPVVHLFSHPELVMIDGLGVAADGAVRSVLLKCDVPVEQIRTVARDPASATSNALAKLLLRNHYGQAVEMVDAFSAENHAWRGNDPPGPDATVMIGDRALCSQPAPAGDIDLGDAWKAMTGLPFVFAVWAVRRDYPDIKSVTEIAFRACEKGMESLDALAARYAADLKKPKAFWLDYLDNSIHYRLTEGDRKGMERFRDELISFVPQG